VAGDPDRNSCSRDDPNSVLSAINFRRPHSPFGQHLFDGPLNRGSARLIEPVVIVAGQRPTDSYFWKPGYEIGFDGVVGVISIDIDPVQAFVGKALSGAEGRHSMDPNRLLPAESAYDARVDGVHVGLAGGFGSAVPTIWKCWSKFPGVNEVEFARLEGR